MMRLNALQGAFAGCWACSELGSSTIQADPGVWKDWWIWNTDRIYCSCFVKWVSQAYWTLHYDVAAKVLQHCAGLSHESVEAFEVQHVIFKSLDGMKANHAEWENPKFSCFFIAFEVFGGTLGDFQFLFQVAVSLVIIHFTSQWSNLPWFVSRSEASIPVEKAFSPYGGVLLAYEMNDESLGMEHGAPVRAIAGNPGKL